MNQFSSFADFIDMGGYGAFVWPSYFLTLLLLVIHVVLPLMRRRSLIKQINKEARRSSRREAQKAPVESGAGL